MVDDLTGRPGVVGRSLVQLGLGEVGEGGGDGPVAVAVLVDQVLALHEVHASMVRRAGSGHEWQDCLCSLGSCHGSEPSCRRPGVLRRCRSSSWRWRARCSASTAARWACRATTCASAPTTSRPSRPTAPGFTIDTPHRLETLAWADTIIVPGWPSPKTAPPAAEVCEALRRAHRRGARFASLCSGAYVLAAAGLLDGARATTHWMYAEDFAARYPQIDVDPGVLYVGDGQVWTSAGTAAAIDLCLHFVRMDHGAEVANVVARRMVVPAHRDGGQAQYVQAPVPETCSDDDLASTLDWAVQHLDQELGVEDLARRARMSPRTFARRFKLATGHDAAAVAADAAGRAGPATARRHRPADRDGGRAVRVRVGGHAAPALRPGGGHVAAWRTARRSAAPADARVAAPPWQNGRAGDVAQLARASALHAEGRGFESHRLHTPRWARTGRRQYEWAARYIEAGDRCAPVGPARSGGRPRREGCS